jgi:Bacterial SH3 domain
MQSRKPLRIEVPKEEGLRLGRVGLIAVIGFAVGILWPRLAGVRLVPSLPSEKSDTSGADLSGAPVDAGAASAAPVEPAAPPPPPSKELFTVGAGEVTSCRNERGKKRLAQCDAVDFDGIARGRIATLAACGAAEHASGVLSLGFDLDFQKDRVVGVQNGKGTSLDQDDEQALLACLKQNLGEVSLSGIHHEYDRYTVFYRVEFAGSESEKKTKPAADIDVTEASGKATVAWDVALVRSGPARDSEVVARVLSGTRVSVTGRNGDWYRIKYDAKGGSGWVFRTAIGM